MDLRRASRLGGSRALYIREQVAAGEDADYIKELPLPESSMADLFEESAERVPERDTIRYFDGTISYRELKTVPTASRHCSPLGA